MTVPGGGGCDTVTISLIRVLRFQLCLRSHRQLVTGASQTAITRKTRRASDPGCAS
jgi:hypothetical protein